MPLWQSRLWCSCSCYCALPILFVNPLALHWHFHCKHQQRSAEQWCTCIQGPNQKQKGVQARVPVKCKLTWTEAGSCFSAQPCIPCVATRLTECIHLAMWQDKSWFQFRSSIRQCLFTGLDYWTGLLDWTTGLDYWTGLLDWTTGLDYWTGLLDWTTGLDYWTGLLDWTTGLTQNGVNTFSSLFQCRREANHGHSAYFFAKFAPLACSGVYIR